MQGVLSFSAGSVCTFRTGRKSVITGAFVEAPCSRRAESLYEVLRVNQNATIKEIKAAYRTLAKLYHPDVSAASAAAAAAVEFIEIHEAYEKLSDPEKRAEYDAARRTEMMYGFRAYGEYYTGRRWETDQCW